MKYIIPELMANEIPSALLLHETPPPATDVLEAGFVGETIDGAQIMFPQGN